MALSLAGDYLSRFLFLHRSLIYKVVVLYPSAMALVQTHNKFGRQYHLEYLYQQQKNKKE